jgi:hypothetical protein
VRADALDDVIARALQLAGHRVRAGEPEPGDAPPASGHDAPAPLVDRSVFADICQGDE